MDGVICYTKTVQHKLSLRINPLSYELQDVLVGAISIAANLSRHVQFMFRNQ